MSLLMRPGVTLLLLAVVAFVLTLFIDVIPVLGPWLSWILRFVAVFGVVGGIWLLVMGRKSEAA